MAKDKYGCDVVNHETNKGYGKALKTGNQYFIDNYSEDKTVKGIIHCDCDGQHAIQDVNKCYELLIKNDKSLIVGQRNFDLEHIPFKSKIGNILTSIIFKLFFGIKINDTQCGLRGISSDVVYFSTNIDSDGYAYTSQLLIEAEKEKINIILFPIETIYINNNETTHFNPLKDSIKIYAVIFKYLLSSLSASIVDLIVFSILFNKLGIITSTYLARIVSSIYTFIINKSLVFNSKDNRYQVPKYIALCILIVCLSAFFTNTLTLKLRINPTIVKVVVDTSLFFLSYYIQKKMIFNK